jgi:2-polyprenyl-3-methyl-5-hydroxy-6-metoxy-1,4-benzoquinol methylase
VRAERFDRIWYKFAEELLPEAHTYPRAVDLGCGRGEFAQVLRGEGFSVVGLDANPQNVTACKELGFEAKRADLNQRLPLDDNSFDLAVMLDVIEHIPLADTLLVEAARILRKDGLLLLSTPNAAWILHRIRGLLGHPPPGEGYHFRFFVRSNLTNILNQAGFEIVRRNSWTYPLPSVNRLRRYLGQPRIDWHVPAQVESLWAYSLVWLSRKTKRSSQRLRQVWEKPSR